MKAERITIEQLVDDARRLRQVDPARFRRVCSIARAYVSALCENEPENVFAGRVAMCGEPGGGEPN